MTENNEAIDQIYNVALNDRTSLNDLHRMIEDKIIQRVQDIEKKEPIYRDFNGDVRHSQASVDKAYKLLEYRPKYKISDGLDETIDWYINFKINNIVSMGELIHNERLIKELSNEE